MPWSNLRVSIAIGSIAFFLVSTEVRAVVQVEQTRVADFENFSEGRTFRSDFTDPVSGIRFYDQVSLSSSFVIEYMGTYPGSANAPHMVPGQYLGTNGYSSGPGGGVGPSKGFKGQLPDPAKKVGTYILFFSEEATIIQMLGFNDSGQIVANSSIDVPAFTWFQELYISAESANYDIRRFWLLTPSNTLSMGWDKVSYTYLPEPATAALLIPLAMLTARRRR